MSRECKVALACSEEHRGSKKRAEVSGGQAHFNTFNTRNQTFLLKKCHEGHYLSPSLFSPLPIHPSLNAIVRDCKTFNYRVHCGQQSVGREKRERRSIYNPKSLTLYLPCQSRATQRNPANFLLLRLPVRSSVRTAPLIRVQVASTVIICRRSQLASWARFQHARQTLIHWHIISVGLSPTPFLCRVV